MFNCVISVSFLLKSIRYSHALYIVTKTFTDSHKNISLHYVEELNLFAFVFMFRNYNFARHRSIIDNIISIANHNIQYPWYICIHLKGNLWRWLYLRICLCRLENIYIYSALRWNYSLLFHLMHIHVATNHIWWKYQMRLNDNLLKNGRLLTPTQVLLELFPLALFYTPLSYAKGFNAA